MAYLYLKLPDGRMAELRGNRKDVEAASDLLHGRVPDAWAGHDLNAR